MIRLIALICYLFKDVISNRNTTTGQMTLWQRIIERNECKRKWSGLMFKVLFQRLPGGTYANHEKSSRKTGVRADVRNPNLYNKVYAHRMRQHAWWWESYESRAGIGISRTVSRLRPASAWWERKITRSPLRLWSPHHPNHMEWNYAQTPKNQTQKLAIVNLSRSHIYHEFGEKNNSILRAFILFIFIYVALNDAVTISD